MTAAEIAQALERARPISGGGFTACCPAHDDTEPSLSIADGDKGPVVHCHAGCTQEEVIEALAGRGVDIRKTNGNGNGHTAFNVAELAFVKNLSRSMLDSCGVTDQHMDDGATIVGFEYRDARDEPTGMKFRRALAGNRGFFWRKGSVPSLYGLWRVEAMRAIDNRFVICEGETDALTLWKHDFSALGLPGASMWREAWLAEIPADASVYVIVEPDRGGEAVEAWLAKSALKDRAKLVRMPKEFKDPSALHINSPDLFTERFEKLLTEALPFGAKPALWPLPIDLKALLATDPHPPRMIVPDWLPCGYATMLAGHGGAGKSSAALHLAAAIAQGVAWWGLSTERRRVVYLSCEDRRDILHWRLNRICAREQWIAANLSGLLIRDLVGYDAILYRSSFGDIAPTAAYDELARIMADDPTALLIVDGIADTYGGNENDRSQVKMFVNALVRLVSSEGAVLLVHHVNKQSASGATGNAEGYSGSTGWHNAVRARWYLRPETETDEDGHARRADGKLVLELQKSNLGKPDQQVPLHWDDIAHMFVADAPAARLDASLQDTEERAAIVSAIREVLASGDYVPAAAQGPRTAIHVLGACKSFPKSLKSRAGKARFWRHIETLRRNRSISECVIKRSGRHDTTGIALEAAPNKD